MRARRSALSEAEINLTPLIDVVFVILIMFIVVAPLLEIEKIQLADGPSLEGSNTLPANQNNDLVIHVFGDNKITVNQRPVALSQLKEVFVFIKERKPLAKPQLFQDRHAEFGTFQSVKNALEAAGFAEMDIVLKPE